MIRVLTPLPVLLPLLGAAAALLIGGRHPKGQRTLSILVLSAVLTVSVVLLLLADVIFRRRPVLTAYAAVALPLAAVWLWRAHLYADLPVVETPFVDNPLVAADFWTARLTAFKVLARYVLLLVWPATLAPDYSYRQITPAGWSDPLALCGLALVGLAAISGTRLAPVKRTPKADYRGRSTAEMIRSPAIFVPIFAGMASYALMTLVMVAAPLAMVHSHNHTPADAAGAIQWHIVAMFLPSLVTGPIIARIGAPAVVAILMLIVHARAAGR